ncbi:MAG: hypothetical protein AAF549_01110 [Pseudomonadota bacterium]
MIYVPDAKVLTVEHPPSNNFFKASTKLMFRWFGNMLRTNGRALALGPWQIGLFPWWCILDQRISMWTALSGPVFMVLLSLKLSAVFVPIYFVWVGFTRWVMALMLYAARGTISWHYPFLIYYSQIWGSLIKTYVFFRLDKQSWTRQKTKLNRGLSQSRESFIVVNSNLVYAAAMMIFICFVGLISGVLEFPV